MNRFSAALSTEADLDAAVASVTKSALAGLKGARADVAFLVASHDHAGRFDELPRRVKQATGAAVLLGCAAETVVGGTREVEHGPALSLWVASFPDAEIESFHLEVESEDDEIRVLGFPGLEQGVDATGERICALLLAEPHSFPADLFLQQVNELHPGLRIFGGMASGGARPGANRLFLDEQAVSEGAVGLLLRGVRVRHVVSQGCRPVGRSMVITRAKENVIEELAGKPPLERLQEIYDESDELEKKLLARAFQGGGLHIGQVVDEKISQPERGDFLVRTVMGADQKSGALHIGDHARRGRTVRFHVRDAVSADEDLNELLGGARKAAAPAGALLFTCNGRGTRLFEKPDHDASSIRASMGEIPVAGFFAAGEIGPIGGRNFLHGFTASVALFEAE